MFKNLFFSSEWHFYTWKEKKHLKHRIFEFFVQMLLKFEIIWMRIGQVIRLWNDIDFSESVYGGGHIPEPSDEKSIYYTQQIFVFQCNCPC